MKHPKPEFLDKWSRIKFTTLRRLKLWVVAVPLIVVVPNTVPAGENAPFFPSFRHVDVTNLDKTPPNLKPIKILVDEDFAPWSFLAADGNVQGISTDLAAAACAEAHLQCEVIARPFATLLPELRSGGAQLIASGLRPDDALLKEFLVTRPYFRSLARFAVRQGSPLASPDVRTLAGKRLGFVQNTSHARFIETYFSRSALMPFATSLEMQDALRTGQVDVVFGDAMQLSFWLSAAGSRGCCAFLGKAFLHRDTFSRSLVFVAAKNESETVAALDNALDQLEVNTTTANIFARYLPSPIW